MRSGVRSAAPVSASKRWDFAGEKVRPTRAPASKNVPGGAWTITVVGSPPDEPCSRCGVHECVDEHVAAQRFADVDPGRDCGVGTRRPDEEVLGPHAEDHGTVGRRDPGHLDTGDPDDPLVHDGREEVHRRASHEPRDERVGRPVVDVVRGADLLDLAVRHHADPVTQRHRLHLVVGHVDRGHRQLAVQALEVPAYLGPQLRVEVGQRLVEQERLGPAYERTTHGHPLPLATRELAGLAVEQLVDVEQDRRLAHPPVDLGPGRTALTEPVGEVLVDAHVGVERVVLEHHRDVALPRSQPGDRPAGDLDLPRRRLVEAGEESQRGALAAPRRADQDQELPVRDGQVEPLQRHHVSAETAGDADVLHFGHQPFNPVPATDWTKYRCATTKTTSIGSRLITLPAISSGQFVEWAPWK